MSCGENVGETDGGRERVFMRRECLGDWRCLTRACVCMCETEACDEEVRESHGLRMRMLSSPM